VAPSVHKVTVSSHDQTILDLKNQRRRLKAQCKRVCLATFAQPKPSASWSGAGAIDCFDS
jgi:hypothetical protein